MRKYLWIIVFLIFTPCARADTYLVSSGYFQPIGGTGGDNIFLSGDGFTATGNISVGAPNCFPYNFRAGQAITGCLSQFVGGVITVVHNGVEEQVQYGFDLMAFVSQADMFLSGATQATLSEPALFGLPAGCVDEVHFPNCTPTFLEFPSDTTLTMSLTQDTVLWGYDVTSEVYTFGTPEPSTFGLVLLGIGSVLVVRKRVARGLPQDS
jgi:hypothetical protein